MLWKVQRRLSLRPSDFLTQRTSLSSRLKIDKVNKQTRKEENAPLIAQIYPPLGDEITFPPGVYCFSMYCCRTAGAPPPLYVQATRKRNCKWRTAFELLRWTSETAWWTLETFSSPLSFLNDSLSIRARQFATRTLHPQERSKYYRPRSFPRQEGDFLKDTLSVKLSILRGLTQRKLTFCQEVVLCEMPYAYQVVTFSGKFLDFLRVLFFANVIGHLANQ